MQMQCYSSYISTSFKLEFSNPEMYLSAKLYKPRLHNGVLARSPVKYVLKAVRNCAVHLAANYGGTFRLPNKAGNPLRCEMIQSWIPVES